MKEDALPKFMLALLFAGSLATLASAAGQPSWIKAWDKYNQAASLISDGKNKNDEWQFNQRKIDRHRVAAERLLNEAARLMDIADKKEHVLGRATETFCAFGRAMDRALKALHEGARAAMAVPY